jgi:anthranilate/para-aminobenzoate synthase component I
MPLYVESLRSWSSISDTFVAFYSNQPNCFWLDRTHHTTSQFSVIGSGVPSEFAIGEQEYEFEPGFSFRPFLVGVLHYASDALAGQFLKVDRAIVYEHASKTMHFVGDCDSREEFELWHAGALLRLALLGGNAASYELEVTAATSALLTPDDSQSDYMKKILQAQQHIASGDVYQLCLTTRLRGEFTGDPLSYFLRLRKKHPAPYASFVRIEGVSFVSISPERLIEVSGRRVLSSPIKGTAPRGADPEEDTEILNRLSQDPKERAENLMIVDLIRNDLSVSCKPESVIVESLLAVRSFSTVHQLVSDVSATLQDGKSGFDALLSLFPGGSMTGAPKIRAVQIIDELESSERGPYSGGIGWIGKDGSMDLGMVIRTAVFEGSTVTIGIGGGITSDSSPAAEHAEIQLKARALVSELSAVVAW